MSNVFPTPTVRTPKGQEMSKGWPGMTLRDLFAGIAMHAMLPEAVGDWDDTAICAYGMADAMLEEDPKSYMEKVTKHTGSTTQTNPKETK